MILQFAKLPPPIGGVTIHVRRLFSSASKKKNVKMELLDYSNERNLKTILTKVIKSKIIHIHLSNKKLRVFITFLFKLIFKKSVITFHGK